MKVQDAFKRLEQLKTEYGFWKSAHKDLSDYINPFRGIFDNNRSKVGTMMDHKRILSAHATHALRIFASGLNSGMTNKSNEWFELDIEDDAILDLPGVREWIDAREKDMYSILNQSNIYEAFYNTYEELGEFGTGCFLILEDYDEVIRARTLTCGEYYLGINNKGRPNSFGREFEMTVEQIVQQFGLESCSNEVSSSWKNNEKDKKIKISHLIEENSGRDPEKADKLNMPFRSVYWETGNSNEKFLARRGFKVFPVVAPRWDTITTDSVYGYGPGWHALGSVKELQATRLDKLMAQSKLHNPPMLQDANQQGHVNLLPGGVTRTSLSTPNSGVRPAYQINPQLESFIELINEEKEEIDRFFFVNLFMMLASMDKRQMTAEEVATRQQEKIMMMGPALHRLDNEMLTPALEIVWNIMEENGLIPPPPAELQGREIKIKFTSILAQAQKAVGIAKIDRVIAMAGNLASMGRLDAMDNLDVDEIVRETSDLEGAPSKVILDKDVVASVREERAKQQQQAMALQAGAMGAKATKDLATAPMGEGSALDGLMKGMPK